VELQHSQIQNQQQKQILSQTMQQSLKILELSCVELGQYLREAYEDNPFLELDLNDNAESYDKISERINQNDFNTKTRTDDYDLAWSPLDHLSQPETFSDYLMKQIGLLPMDNEDRVICGYIIESLNEHGYFMDDCIEIANILNISNDKFYDCLNLVKALEPAGVGAQSLEECLLMQIARKTFCTPNHQIIIKNHLKDIAEGKFAHIQKKLHLSREVFEEILSDIKDLEPRPSRGFCQDHLDYSIIPEAKIEVRNNELHIIWMKERMPCLRISNSSKEIIDKNYSGENQVAYKSCMEEIEKAQEIIKTVEMREITLISLIRQLCEFQKEYLLGRISHMTPCSMKEAAEMLQVHESTISRAVKGKFIEWKGEVIPIRKFFPNIGKSEEGIISTDQIKDEIKELIINEDKKCPLSDEKLMEILHEKGFIIKRRTVAKYRESIGYGSSTHRKYL